ncbi:MAG: peptidylprolyl isomerase, partial [Planctomycetaceae bacterium]|nr:peptidylprolyl isomerase [Planctomycetaceae bacterium]
MLVQLPAWLRGLRRRPVVRRHRRPSSFSIATESLESRTLLAGNVVAAVANGNLTITGDAANNSVEVTVVDGDIVVRGLDGTTVNGSANTFVAFADTTTITGNLAVSLAAGLDTLRLTGPLTVNGTTRILDVLGASQIGITDVTLKGLVMINTGHDGDTVSLVGAELTGDLKIDVGGGQNLVSVFDSTVEGDVFVTAGGQQKQFHGLRPRPPVPPWVSENRLLSRLRQRHEGLASRLPSPPPKLASRLEELLDRHARNELDGQNDIIIEDSTTGSLWFFTGKGADNVIVQDSTIEGNIHGNTGAGNDFVLFDGATVTGQTHLLLMQGDDSLVTENTNTFEGNVFADGGPLWNDSEQLSDETTFEGRLTLRRFEHSTVSDATIEARGADTLDAAAEVREELNGVEDSGGSNNSDPPPLTLDTTMNDDVAQSNGTLVTTQTMFTIEGQTAPGATIGVTGGPTGQVNLGTTTANSSGHFSIDVSLLIGSTTIKVTSTTEGGSTTEEFNLHRAVGTVVRFASSEGSFDVELLDDDAPITVANFISYFEEYMNSFVHRAGNGSGGVPSVVQGGGFFLDGTTIKPITTTAPITNEFKTANSNVAGTLSMA